MDHPTGTKGRHAFHQQFHHPIIEVAQHVISPLTAALFIFTAHKVWQAPAAFAYLRSAALLIPRGEWNWKQHRRGALFGVTGLASVWYARKQAPVFETSDEVEKRRAGLQNLYNREDVERVDTTLTRWWTTAYVNRALVQLHDSWSLPWWATIMGVTIALRCVLVPVNCLLLQNSLRMKILLPEIDAFRATLNSHTATHDQKVQAARDLMALFRKHKCSPWNQTIIFPLLLPPTILSIFSATHNLCMVEPQLAEEGALWFPDLIEQDHTMLLPILSGLTWLAQVELGAGVHYGSWPTVRLMVRTLSVATISLAATLPSGVFVFWITSNLFAVARALVLQRDSVRRLLKIPLRSEIAALSHLPGWIAH
jgi:YidC/Oxa1 family membrane protein insertase